MRDEFIKLTNAVCKILEFFPESDPLKTRAKDKALSIMDSLVFINEASGWTSFQKEKIKSALSEDVDILLGYLEIAKNQRLISSFNFLIVVAEYEKIKKENRAMPGLNLNFENIEASGEPAQTADQGAQNAPPYVLKKEGARINDVSFYINNDNRESRAPNSENISLRQKTILEFINKNGKAQVMDLQAVLGSITKRTIRRDLDELLQMGKISRSGEFNSVFYRINK